MSELFYCVRVYPNGQAKHTLRDEAGKDSWLNYNKKYRPGNTLFINGKIHDEFEYSSLSTKDIAFIEAELAKRPVTIKQDVIGSQWDGESYTGYKPEDWTASFKFKVSA